MTGVGRVTYLLALLVSVTLLYSLMLGLTGLLFFCPGFFYTWIFNSVVQMVRYPLNLYPGWLRLLLTWVLPVELMTTRPVQALTHNVAWPVFGGGVVSPGIAALCQCVQVMVSCKPLSLHLHPALRRYRDDAGLCVNARSGFPSPLLGGPLDRLWPGWRRLEPLARSQTAAL